MNKRYSEIVRVEEVVSAKKMRQVDSRSNTVRGVSGVKIVQRDSNLSGTRVFNVSEQRRKESYQKINRMLGGAR